MACALRKHRLLQTELLAGREQFNRLANAPFPRLRALGRVNPHDEITPVRSGQAPESVARL